MHVEVLVHAIYIELAKIVHIFTIYDHKSGDFPAKNTVYTPYLYGSGQP